MCVAMQVLKCAIVPHNAGLYRTFATLLGGRACASHGANVIVPRACPASIDRQVPDCPVAHIDKRSSLWML